MRVSANCFRGNRHIPGQGVAARKPDRTKMAEPYKEYPGAFTVELPKPESAGGRSFNEAP